MITDWAGRKYLQVRFLAASGIVMLAIAAALILSGGGDSSFAVYG